MILDAARERKYSYKKAAAHFMPQAAAFARDTAPAAVFEARAGRPAVAMMMMSAKIAVAIERRRIQESIALPKTSEEAAEQACGLDAGAGQFEKF